MLITIVAGARPNFMKIAPIIHAIHKAKQEGKDIDYRLVHTYGTIKKEGTVH